MNIHLKKYQKTSSSKENSYLLIVSSQKLW